MAVRKCVTRYIVAKVTIAFPEDEGIQCNLCPCLETYARKQCRLTGEYLADGYLIGGLCPLNYENKEDENVQNTQGA